MVAWLIAIGDSLGHTAGFVRLPFVVTEAAGAVAVGVAAALIAGDRVAGACAAVAFALVPETTLALAQSVPDGAFLCAWACALAAAAALARGASPAATVALGVALGAAVLARTFGWALVAGIVAWALTVRRDRLAAVAAACALALASYLPFVWWNATTHWENLRFSFAQRQALTGFSAAALAQPSTRRLIAYAAAIVLVTWLLALRRAPRLALVAWTAIPLPAALIAFSFVTKTESYWLVGPLASLAVAAGIALARAGTAARACTFGLLALASAAAFANVLFLGLPERAQAAIYDARPGLRGAFRSGVYAYAALADDLRREGAGSGLDVLTDYYQISAELLWYGVPSRIVGDTVQIPQWTRWYGGAPPRRAVLVTEGFPLGALPGVETRVRRAFASVGPSRERSYRRAGTTIARFYLTALGDPTADAALVLPGLDR